MKKITLITVLLLILTSCVGRKQIEKQLNSGNYDLAINNALKKLDNNKYKKRKQDYVLLLEDAFYKVVEDNHNTINHLKKDGNPELYEQIFNIYLDLEVDYRAKVSEQKYTTAVALMKSASKYNNRRAFNNLKYIESINPNYKDVRQLIDVAHHQGTDYVIVDIENHTHQIIPIRLQNDLLNFDTYGLNDFWTVYHANENQNIEYD